MACGATAVLGAPMPVRVFNTVACGSDVTALAAGPTNCGGVKFPEPGDCLLQIGVDLASAAIHCP